MTETKSADFFEEMNQLNDGWCKAMGLRFTSATRDEVRGELSIGPEHLQAYGIVHGGVYAGIIETLASVGAAVDAMTRNQTVVGLDNQTSFLKAVRSGPLRGTATPLTRGRRTQLWEGRIHDEQGRLVATGRVRLLCLDPGSELAGETAAPKPNV